MAQAINSQTKLELKLISRQQMPSEGNFQTAWGDTDVEQAKVAYFYHFR